MLAVLLAFGSRIPLQRGGAWRPSREVKCGPRASEVRSTRRSCLFSEWGGSFVQQKQIISNSSSTSQITA